MRAFVPSRILALILLAASRPPAPAFAAPEPAFVSIENFTFKPAALTVHAGTRVTFKNADDIPHSVVMSDGSFHSPALDTGESAVVVFAKPGAYTYFCGLHPKMQGAIKVVP